MLQLVHITDHIQFNREHVIRMSYHTLSGRTDARTCARTHPCERVHTPPHADMPPSPYRYSMGLCQPTVTARSAGDKSWSLAIEINTGTGGPVSPRFWVFFAYKKMLGRTRERMYCQSIRTIRDISRDDRARIATCSLRTRTDRLKENYRIDSNLQMDWCNHNYGYR